MDIYTSNKPTRCNRPLEFLEALRLSFSNIFNFKGRARRSEYWWTALGLYLMTIVVYFLALFLGIGTTGFALFNDLRSVAAGSFVTTYTILCLWSVVIWVLMLALIFRRLHDTGHSGWLIGANFLLGIAGFITLAIGTVSDGGSMPLIAIAVLLLIAHLVLSLYIFFLTLFDSDVEENKYGPSQKYALEEDEAAEAAADDYIEQTLEETLAEEQATPEQAEE